MVYLSWEEPPAQVAEKIASIRQLAAAEGRTLKFGMRLHVIVRETEAEAWDAANHLYQSYHSIICHELAHIETDECVAPEFFSNGAKLLLAKCDFSIGNLWRLF